MELGLRLGECSKQACFKHVGLGLNTTLSIGPNPTIISTKTCSDEEDNQDDHHHEDELEEEEEEEEEVKINDKKKKQENHEEVVAMNTSSSLDNHKNKNKLHLHLLPPTPVLPLSSFPWPPNSDSDHGNYSGGGGEVGGCCSRLPASSAAGEEEESEGRAAVTSSSSPNSAASSFQVDLCIYNNKLGRRETLISRSGNNGNNNNYNYNYYHEQKGRRCSSSRGGITMSDEDDNVVGGGTRKKLRLSKQQSAFLEDTFKQHSTLNPKQKLGVAKELNLRPRQVEVWFQNRRARTKLKQTEVECEYLKRCCERISEENKRLHKELHELRALNTSSSNPFFMQLPPTTLTMCPSCERVAPNPTTPSNNNTSNHSKPNFFPFPHSKPHHHQP